MPEINRAIYYFAPQVSILYFKYIRYRWLCPFVIYENYESLLKHKRQESHVKPCRTLLYQQHIPNAVGVYTTTAYGIIYSSEYETYTLTVVISGI